MPVECVGALGKEHTVTVDAQENWPTVAITCSCGWSFEQNGEDEHSLKDAIARVWIHTGGPVEDVRPTGESLLLDLNIMQERFDVYTKGRNVNGNS